MKTNTLLFITGILALSYSVSLLLMPQLFLEMRGGPSNDYTNFLARAVGALALGYAVLGIMARKSQSIELLKIAATTNMVAWAACGVVMFMAKMSLPFNSMIWVDISLCLTLSVAFGFYVFSSPKA